MRGGGEVARGGEAGGREGGSDWVTTADNVSANGRPADDVSANRTPADNVSANRRPADDVSATRTPADNMSANRTPADQIPANDVSAMGGTRNRPSERGCEPEVTDGTVPAWARPSKEEMEDIVENQVRGNRLGSHYQGNADGKLRPTSNED